MANLGIGELPRHRGGERTVAWAGSLYAMEDANPLATSWIAKTSLETAGVERFGVDGAVFHSAHPKIDPHVPGQWVHFGFGVADKDAAL